MHHTPPRLLTGTIILIWGGLTGHTALALIAAIMLESRAWIGLRWDFKQTSYIKAWQLSVLIGVLVAAIAWLNGLKVDKIHTLFVWAPLILLPLELTQRYGKAATIPLNTFSFFARKKMDGDIAHGRSISPRMVNTGYPYIALIILATAMASRHSWHHFAGLSIMLASCLFFYTKNKNFRPIAWSTALLLTLTLGFAGQWTMHKLYKYFTGGRHTGGGDRTYTNESRTSIGKLGKLKLSPKIFWRMSVYEGNTPPLLSTATYNYYTNTRWSHKFTAPLGSNALYEDDFTEDTRINAFRERDTRTFAKNTDIKLSTQGDLRIIGGVSSALKNNPIPLPEYTLAFGDLGEEPFVSRNSLGTVRIGNPENHVIQYTVWLGKESTTEDPPVHEFDLHIPPPERKAITRVAQQLGLTNPQLSTRGKINKLRDFFNQEFYYTTHLQTPNLDKETKHTAIGTFLETTRAGHCEYFATATALLLREAKIPTRYCVGFAVNEQNRNEWIMRGHHAHAWCRVWIPAQNSTNEHNGHWENLDLTPAAWHTMDHLDQAGWQRKFIDWWQLFREDFLIWRTGKTNQTKVIIISSIIVTVMILWIGWRLWNSRQQKITQKRQPYRRPKDAPTTELHKLESLIAKKIGHRPKGTPLCKWMLTLGHIYPRLSDQLRHISELHSRLRFDPVGTPTETSDELITRTKELKKFLKQKDPNKS